MENKKIDNKNTIFVLNSVYKVLHKKGCNCAEPREFHREITLNEIMNSNTGFTYCRVCHPEHLIPNAPTKEELMYRKSNVAEKYNLYWLMNRVAIFFVIIGLLFMAPLLLTYEPGYDDASFMMGMGSAIFIMVLFGLPCFLYALNIKKNFGEHFTESIKEEHKETKKTIYKISLVVLIASIIIGVIIGLIATAPSRRKDKYDDIWDKDPNTWTEDEEEYVNDFFDWMDENN